MTGYLPSTSMAECPQWDGIYTARVIAVSGVSVKLRIPQVLAGAESNWAAPLNPGQGLTPNTGDTVFAAFLGGDVRYPVYLVPGNSVTPAMIQQLAGSVVSGKVGTNAATLTPSGVPAAGSTGLLADFGHTHPGTGQTGSISAFHPGSTTVAETWQACSLAGGVTNRGTGYPNLSVKKLADSDLVMIAGDVTYTGVFGNPSVWGHVPSAYFPANEQMVDCRLYNNSGSTFVAPAAGFMRTTVSATGAVTMYGVGSTGTVTVGAAIFGVYPLTL